MTATWWNHDTVPCTPRHPPWLRLPLLPAVPQKTTQLPVEGVLRTDRAQFTEQPPPRRMLKDMGLTVPPKESQRAEFYQSWASHPPLGPA